MAEFFHFRYRVTDLVPGVPTSGDDFLFGTDDSDLIDGLAGNDNISGYGSRDLLYGRAGHDALFGGDGDDALNGGADADFLEGGAGADVFVYLKAKDSTIVKNLAEPGHFTSPDTIFDFNGAEGDLINLHRIDANIHRTGDQKFRFIEQRDFTGRGGELRLEVGETSTLLCGDTDGDKKAELVIELTGVVSSDELNFYL